MKQLSRVINAFFNEAKLMGDSVLPYTEAERFITAHEGKLGIRSEVDFQELLSEFRSNPVVIEATLRKVYGWRWQNGLLEILRGNQ